MKNKHYLLTGCIFLHIALHAQVKIGDNATSISAASLLELEATDKGFVLPRVSITDVSTSSPLASGLLIGTVVYNTNSSTTGGSGTGVYYWDGSEWNFLTNSTTSLNYWSLTGNSGLSASANFIGTTDAVDFSVRTNNATRMRIRSNGNIGIGTTSPTQKLHVVGNFYLNGAFMPGGSAGTAGDILTSAGTGTSPTWTSPNSIAWTLTGNSGTSASTNFIGTTDAIDFVVKTNNTERIHVLGAASGNSKEGWIGMGITPPRSSLDVTGNFTNKNVITVQNTSSSGYSSVDMMDNSGNLVGTFGYGNPGTGAFFGSRDYFSFYGHDFVMNTNSGNYNFFLNGSTGNIGINTGSPSERLHVVGNFYLNGAFMPGGSAGTSGYILTSAGAGTSPTWTNPNSLAWTLTGNSGTSASTNFIGTTDAIDFVAKTNNIERMRVTSGGNVGINTSSPGSTLDVNGTLRLSGSSSGYVALAPAAAAGSTTYTLPSADGTAGQALVTNGSGTLSWAITAATIGTIGAGATIPGTATGKYYCTGSYITLPPGKFIVNVYMMLSSTTNPMTQTIANTPGSFFIKSFFADASLGTTAGATVSPALPQSNVSPDVVGNGKLISGSLSVGQTYNPISGSVVINNTSGANKSYYYWAGWVSLTNVSSLNSLPLIGGTFYGEDNMVAYPTN